MSHLRAIVFDFDLTLADTTAGIVECVNYSITGIGLPPAPADAIYQTIGITHDQRFLKLAGPQHIDRFPQYLELYQERSRQVMEAMTTFYPATPSVVRRLKQRGVRMGIVSSAYRFRVEMTLRKADLMDCFEAILGYEDMSIHKPDPTGLLEVVRRLGSVPPDTLYVGDSVVDAEAAQRAGMPFVAVLTGPSTKRH